MPRAMQPTTTGRGLKGDLTDQDKLSYITGIKGKLLENETLLQQAENNTEGQFSTSPDLMAELLNAIIVNFEADAVMSTQAINGVKTREEMISILLNPMQLWKSLRDRAAARRNAA